MIDEIKKFEVEVSSVNEHQELSNLVQKLMNDPIDYKKVLFKPKRDAP